MPSFPAVHLPSPESLPARRPLLAACSVALGSLVPVTLFQLHLIAHLPDPPGSFLGLSFNSDAIASSRTAHPFSIPDSLPGLASYTATFALILACRRSPRYRPLLAGKLALDGAAAAFSLVRQVIVFRRLCSWCTLTVAATGVMVYFGRPLLADAAGRLADSLPLPADQELPVLDALSPAG